MTFLNCLLSFTLFFLTITSPAQTARAIVYKYLDTVSNGDIRHWDKITSTHAESTGFYSQGKEWSGNLTYLLTSQAS